MINIRTRIAAVFAALIVFAAAPAVAQQVAIDNDDIGGVVTGPNGPEAGVWVIAETHDLPTRYIKIVVTDDQGRYVIPDLPKANYDVWVRGYGLVDSPKVKSEPGKIAQPGRRVGAERPRGREYYPAIYWYAMMAEIPGHRGAQRQGCAGQRQDQPDYLNAMKNNGCIGCHQLGQLATRTIPEFHEAVKNSYEDAWVHRMQSGQAGENMTTIADGQLGGMPYKYLGDWTDRMANGELPSPSRGGRRASSATSSSRCATGTSQTVPARPDLDRQALSDRQR